MVVRISAVVLITSAVFYVGGCQHDRADNTAGASSNKTAAPEPAKVGPGNTPALKTGLAAADVKKFWFDSPYDPKGKRVWTRVGPDKWDETAADGTVNHYVGSDHYDMGGYHGIMVRGGPDDLNILIPDGGKGAFVRFREAAGGRNWSLIAPIDGVE